MRCRRFAIGLFALMLSPLAFAHPGDDVDAYYAPPTSEVKIEVRDGIRYITSNGIPDHQTGQFPNRNNPGTIRPQSYSFEMPADPKENDQFTTIGTPGTKFGKKPPPDGHPPLLFGVALNGVVFDPTTAEWFRDDVTTGWHIEAIGPRPMLGIDSSNAHVQPPTGTYHYHGVPVGLVGKLAGKDAGRKMIQVGWAADGFPAYAIWGYSNANDPKSPLKELKSSYRLKSGNRPTGANSPGGQIRRHLHPGLRIRQRLGRSRRSQRPHRRHAGISRWHVLLRPHRKISDGPTLVQRHPRRQLPPSSPQWWPRRPGR